MSPQTKKELIARSVGVLEVFGVVVAYFAIVAALMYPVLRAGGYLP